MCIFCIFPWRKTIIIAFIVLVVFQKSMKRRDLIIFKIAFRFNYTFYLQPEMSRESLFSYIIVDQGLFYLLNRSVYYPTLDRIFLVIQERSNNLLQDWSYSDENRPFRGFLNFWLMREGIENLSTRLERTPYIPVKLPALKVICWELTKI